MADSAIIGYLQRLIKLHYRINDDASAYHSADEWMYYQSIDSIVVKNRREVMICVRCDYEYNHGPDGCCWSLRAIVDREMLVSDIPPANWELIRSDCRTCRSLKLYKEHVLPWLTVGRLMPTMVVAREMQDVCVESQKKGKCGGVCLICLRVTSDLLSRNVICCNRDKCLQAPIKFVVCSFLYLLAQELCCVADVGRIVGCHLATMCLNEVM